VHAGQGWALCMYLQAASLCTALELDGAAVRTLPEGAETQVRSPPQLRPWTSLLLLPLHTEVPIG
jgi:hypothetical protein